MAVTVAESVGARALQQELQGRFPHADLAPQETRDGIPTFWVARGQAAALIRYLKREAPRPFSLLYDLTAIDERLRVNWDGQPRHAFTVLYHLLSFDRNLDVRLKVGLPGEHPSLPSITAIFPAANWYEREVWDMFGITFEGHPHLRRILLPPWWKGHALRKEHPARATEMEPFRLPEEQEEKDQAALQFKPEEWGMKRTREDTDFMFLNLGPHHPGTHGVLRVVLELDGEVILDAVPEIGFHHRGAEKMGERQSWHSYIPYTDRVDYLSGVLNNLPYVLSVEALAGIDVPPRAQVIRIMMSELFRIASHLVWYGTFAQDLGALSPVFYMFTDRERIFKIVEAVCGFRMHPAWFRIGGVAQDLPDGWEGLIQEFLDYLPRRLDEYDRMVMRNAIFRGRTQGIGHMSLADAVEWGVTGPNLRACGLKWDLRKQRPYSSYDQFEFDIPIALHGDCYDRAVVRVEEMRQSLRIVEQCLRRMPSGPYKSDHPLTTPPRKERTMHDIETLITHFVGVSWGHVIPAGEAIVETESSKGNYGYYLVSDGNTMSYRTRIRAPSFPHMQMLPLLARGLMVPDLIAILGSLDYVLADIDR
jgi:NADH-quinone oxidoreductase subunit C/D